MIVENVSALINLSLITVGTFAENATYFDRDGEDEKADGGFDFRPPNQHNDLQSLQQIVRTLQTNVAPVVTCVGILTNLACLVMISRQPFLSVSASHYVIGILTSDMIHLGYILHNWINELGPHLFFIGGWCQFVTFTRSLSDFLGTWFMASLAADRMISVTSPAWETRMCTPWRARLVVLSIWITGTVVYLNTSLMVGVFYMGNRPVCATLAIFTQTALRLEQADVVINVLVPYIATAALGVAVILLTTWRRQERAAGVVCSSSCRGVDSPDGAANEGGAASREEASLDFTRAFLLLLLIYFALTSPYQILRVKDAMDMLVDPSRPMVLESYLYQQGFLYLKYLKVTINAIIIITCQRHARHLLSDCAGCKQSDCFRDIAKCVMTSPSSCPCRGRSPNERAEICYSGAPLEDSSVIQIISNEEKPVRTQHA